MSRRNRETLKNFFKAGSLPSEQDFADLVDSTLNMVDEGFNKSLEHGLEITTQARRNSLVTFFREDAPSEPLWCMCLDERDRKNLQIRDFQQRTDAESTGASSPDPEERAPEDLHASPPAILTLSPEGRLGVANEAPQRELDVSGIVRSRGREGVVPDLTAPASTTEESPDGTADADSTEIVADGGWHDLTGPLEGCHALEVVAGVGLRRTGRYALLHAIAINVFNPTGVLFNLFRRKKPIRTTQAYYRSRADKLRLQWVPDGKLYRLQIRSNGDYGESNGRKIPIRYHITELWSDPAMAGSWRAPEK